MTLQRAPFWLQAPPCKGSRFWAARGTFGAASVPLGAARVPLWLQRGTIFCKGVPFLAASVPPFGAAKGPFGLQGVPYGLQWPPSGFTVSPFLAARGPWLQGVSVLSAKGSRFFFFWLRGFAFWLQAFPLGAARGLFLALQWIPFWLPLTANGTKTPVNAPKHPEAALIYHRKRAN